MAGRDEVAVVFQWPDLAQSYLGSPSATGWPSFAETWYGGDYPTGQRRDPEPKRGWICGGCGHGYRPDIRECAHCPEKPPEGS